MKKLIKVSISLLGLLMITGCGDSLDASNCEAPYYKGYSKILTNSEFDRDVEIRMWFGDGCNNSNGKDIQGLRFIYDEIYTNGDNEQGFLENLIGYSDQYTYQLNISCNPVPEVDYFQYIDPIFDDLDEVFSCHLILDSSNNSLDLDIHFDMQLTEEQ